jgi:DNA ligase-1
MRYNDLCQLYQKLEATTKRLEKTHYIAEFLKKTSVDDLPVITLLLQGNVFPSWDERKVGMAAKLLLKAINVATGIEKSKLENEWRKTGDLGNTAENFIKKKKQATLFTQELSVKKVFNNLRKLSELVGLGTVDRKVKLVAELLTSAKPLEAKYIVRTLLEELRVGVGAGTLRDAIAWAYLSDVVKVDYNKEKNDLIITDNVREEYNEMIEKVQGAFDVCNDFAVVAEVAKTKGMKGLLSVSLQVGTPIKVMLFPKAKGIENAFERGERH